MAVSIEIAIDDLSSDEVQALVAEHLAGMKCCTPPEHVHALGVQRLRTPEITFWIARVDGALCGCGALKELDDHNGEVKSMRTRAAYLRRGIGQSLLNEIIKTAEQRQYSKLWLETGCGAEFEPAQDLYRRNGFELCEPFANYLPTDFSVFMVKQLSKS